MGGEVTLFDLFGFLFELAFGIVLIVAVLWLIGNFLDMRDNIQEIRNILKDKK